MVETIGEYNSYVSFTEWIPNIIRHQFVHDLRKAINPLGLFWRFIALEEIDPIYYETYLLGND